MQFFMLSLFAYHVTVTANLFSTTMKAILSVKAPMSFSRLYTVLSQQPVSISLIDILVLPLLSAEVLVFITRVETSQIKELCSIFALVFPVSSTGLGELLVLFWERGQ